jgi:glycosidase
VANHSAWDNPWVTSNPEWYTKDENGEMVSPYDWSDVVDLNFDNVEMRNAMTEALKYWVREADVDGYRCDVAGMVPVDFWNNARIELDKIKPVFMLAESEDVFHHDIAFDMTYAWDLHHLMNDIAAGKKKAKELDKYFKKQDTLFPKDAYRMYFITNHDENSWNGTEYERMGEAANTFAVLTFTLPGMPLIYSGQEAAFNERLRFFEKDTIDWGTYALTEFYQKLIKLRKENPALWSGEAGGDMKRIKTSDDDIYAFIRKKDHNAVAVLANLSDKTKEFSIKMGEGKAKESTDWFTEEGFVLEADKMITLSPWEYKVLIMSKD